MTPATAPSPQQYLNAHALTACAPDSQPMREIAIVTTATKVNIKPLEDPHRGAGQRGRDHHPRRASSFRTRPRRSPRRAPSWPSAPAASTTPAQRIPLDVTVGDVVLYSKYGGTEIRYAGEDYLVLSARDVLAVIER